MDALKQRLSGIEASLNKIEALVGSRKDLGLGILRLRQEAIDLDSQFLRPDDTAALLQMLSEKARESDIEVVSTRPSEFRTWYDKTGKPLELENAQCSQIEIDMEVMATYVALTEYMRSLTANKSPRLVIRRFSVEKSQKPSVLHASMTVQAFTLLARKEGRQ
jgi:hypothetical protein